MRARDVRFVPIFRGPDVKQVKNRGALPILILPDFPKEDGEQVDPSSFPQFPESRCRTPSPGGPTTEINFCISL